MRQRKDIRRRKKSFWAGLLAVVLFLHTMPMTVLAESINLGMIDSVSIDLSGYVGKILAPGETISWQTKNVDPWYSNGSETYIYYDMGDGTTDSVSVSAVVTKGTGTAVNDEFTYTHTIKPVSDFSFYSSLSDDQKAVTGWIIKESSSLGVVQDSAGVSINTITLTACYDITWVDGNGVTLKTDTVAYGVTPSYSGSTPTKTATAQYTYTFNNTWSPAVTAVTGAATYTAQFDQTGNSYTVTFDKNGHGIAPTAQTVVYGAKATTPTAPTETGYTFGGWYREAVCTNEWKFDTDTVTEDTTLYAKWTINKYNVTFVDEDGTTVLKAAKEYDYGTAAADIVQPATPTKAATAEYTYSFAGWTPAITDVGATDQTYKATYNETVNQYTITWKDGNGGTLKTDTVAYGVTPSYSGSTPTKTATAQYTYTFNDTWSPAVTAVTGPATYTAQFAQTVNNYTVTFNANGHGTAPTAQTPVAYGAKATTPTAPTETGYTFGGWYKEAACTNAWKFDTDTVTGDTTLYAKWTINKYTVTFDENEHGTAPAAQQVEYGEKVTKPNDLEETGYTFEGWFKEKAGIHPWNFLLDIIKEATTIHAKWSVNNYTVTFDANGYGTAPTAQSVAYGAKATTPTAPTETGYTFGGWYKEAACINAWKFDTDTVTGNTTLYAKWTINKYNVTFVDEDGTTVLKAATAYDYGTAAADIEQPTTTPTKAATAEYTYSFAGWTPAITDVGAADQTYKATYSATVNQYTITWKDGNGGTLKTDTVAYGVTPSYSGSTPTKTATAQYTYTFNNTWSPAVTAVTGAATYTAQFAQTVNNYTVTFDANGHGTAPTAQTPVAYGAKATTPTAPTETGYTFGGWYREAACTNAWKFDTDTVTGDTTLYAKWTINKYTVTFDENEHGTAPAAQQVEYRGKVTKPSDLEETGYTFEGWFKEKSGINPWNFLLDIIQEATTIHAKWSVNNYTVTFDANGHGTVPTAQSVAYGAKATTPTAPAETGYTFGGWYKEAACTNAWKFDTDTVTGDTTLYAKWTINKYNVIFVDEDRTTVLKAATAYDYGTAAADIEQPTTTPTKAATAEYTYTFAGWTPAITDVGATDQTYTATYNETVNQYTITWKDGNGGTLKTDTVAYGVTPSYSGSTPTKTATAQYTYTFNDTWSPTVTAVTGAATYTAQFAQTVNSYTVTFDKNGHGTAPTAQTVTYGAKATTPAAPTETGYTFGGWYREASCTNKWKFDTDTVTEDTTLYAKWTVNKYNVTFVDEDGTTVLKAATAYDYGTAAADIVQPTTTPTKAATAQHTYTFAGWTPAITDVGATDQTYTATYNETVNQYTITWKDGNGETLKTDTVAYGATPSYSGTTPTKTATAQYTYTFNDTWSPAVTAVTGAATYTAQFAQTVNNYTVTFDANGHGTAPTAQSVAYGAKATTPAAPTETGYTFGGWYKEAACTNAWKFDTDTVTEDTTLYAKWTVNKYNVTFVDEDGTTVLKAATEYDYGTVAADIEQPTTTPTKAATAEYTYSFAGWTPAIADVGAEDQTYKATYSATVNQYTITWKDGNGGTLKTDTVAYGVTPSYSGSTPTKTATVQYTYTFNDTWSPAVTAVTGPATYTAQFAQTVNNYTVTFNANGHGTAPTAQSVAYGAKATTPTAPTETGYTFGGWYREAACTNAWKFDTDTVTEDTTLYAKWTVNKYNVTFVDEDGTTVLKAATEYDYGTAAADIEQPTTTPTKAATVQYRFDFVGWMPALADVTRDAIYQASYGENPNVFSISYSLDGGRNANENPSSYVYGIGVAAFQKASRPGYDFEGWFLDETYTQPIQSISNTATGNLTLYAKFVEAEDDSDEEEEEDRPQPTVAAEVPKSPKTGDEGQNINWLFIGLMACVISYRRRISKCHW